MHINNNLKKVFSFVKKWKILLLLIVVGYIVAELILGAAKGSSGYNPKTFLLLLVICEAVFNLGIVLMLVGSGVCRNWRDVIQFKFENVKFGSVTTLFGFHLNRLAALVPFCYLLVTGFNHFPVHITFFIVVDIVITISIYFEIRRKINE